MNNLGNILYTKEPNKIAIISDKSYTYKDIEKYINAITNGLREKKLKKNCKIAILAENDIACIASFLAVLRIGAIAVLVNKNLPPDLINYIVSDSDPVLILTNENIPEYMKDGNFYCENMKENDPAFILYTSGSTGNPKGVIIPHSHAWTIKSKSEKPFVSKLRHLIAAPLYHMNGLSNLEVSLSGGSTIILMKKFDANKAIGLIKKYEVNYISSVPSMISLLLKDLGDIKLPTLRHIVMGSAPVSQSLYRNIKDKLPNVGITIGYGNTEVGPGLFQKHPTLPTPETSVGYPIPGISYRIINGILEIKSPSMMLNYSNQKSNITDDGYFITNDLFEQDENGFFYFLGRADDMFVCGGDNIYPRQLEIILEGSDGVKESAVVGVEDEIKGMKPYAFVTLNKEVTAESINKTVQSKLAINLCPRKIWILDVMPINQVNKIDKKLLKSIAISNLQ